MDFDPNFLGTQGIDAAEATWRGSSYAEVRDQLFGNRYYLVWGTKGDPPLPTYDVTLCRVLRGFWRRWKFQDAAIRTVESQADMRWGADGKGFRRLLHPNGVCLFGRWIIDSAPPGKNYTGYFAPPRDALAIARYSTCCAETRRGRYRSLALVANIYPTLDEHKKVKPVSFITQEDFGGEKTNYLDEAILTTAPNTTAWRRGHGVPVLLTTGLVLFRADKRPTARQNYPIAELDKPVGVPTNSPRFMQLRLRKGERFGDADLDFREEVIRSIYNPGDPEPKRPLVFDIRVTDEGDIGRFLKQRPYDKEPDWPTIGRLEFTEAVASYNGDFVFHARHWPWRKEDNQPALARDHRPRPLF